MKWYQSVPSPPSCPAAGTLVERFILTFRQAIIATTPAKGGLQHKLPRTVLGHGMPVKPFWITNQQFCLADIMEDFVQIYSEQTPWNTDDHVDVKLQQKSVSNRVSNNRGNFQVDVVLMKPQRRVGYCFYFYGAGCQHQQCQMEHQAWTYRCRPQLVPPPSQWQVMLVQGLTRSGSNVCTLFPRDTHARGPALWCFDGNVEFSFSLLQRDMFIVLVLSKAEKDGTSWNATR